MNQMIYFMKLAKIHIVLASLIILSSCREEIDLPLDSTYQRLVVEGSITTDTTSHLVKLSKSGDAYGRDSTYYISGAIVTISDGEKIFYLTESAQKKGYYYTASNVYGEVGKTYTLTIENVDIDNDGKTETYTAQSTIHKLFPIDSISIIRQRFGSGSWGHVIGIYGKDPGERNFYMFRILKNNIPLTDSIKEYSIGVNAGNEGLYYYNLIIDVLSDNDPDQKLNKGDTLTVESCVITQDFYQFINAFQQEYRPKNPLFSGTPANVPTNIIPSEKAIGHFAAYSIQRKSKIY